MPTDRAIRARHCRAWRTAPRFAFEFSDGYRRPQTLAFATRRADDAIDRLRDLCPETLGYKLTPP